MRIVMFVYNDCTTDARVLREAGSLAAAGHRVTIMARPKDVRATVGDREHRDGFEIVRVPLPQGWKRWYGLMRSPWKARGWIRFRLVWCLKKGPARWPEALSIAAASVAGLPWVLVRGTWHKLEALRNAPPPSGGTTLDWIVRWQFSIVGWAKAAAAAAPVADAYHGHDLSGLPGALAASRRHPASDVVYDSHEIYVASGRIAKLPRWVRWILSFRERRWVPRAAALVTVNQSLAEDLGTRYRPRRTVVVRNCPSRWTPPERRPGLLREAAGVPPDAPVILYHGGFSAHRGMEEITESLLEPGMEGVHAVFLGYGSERAALDRRAEDPRYGGRVHVLDAVPPSELAPWVASADVGVMPIQRSTLNHYLSTPNKLFESLAAGVPVVVSDFPEMRRIVMDDPDGPLGATCDPADPASVARAVRSILDLPPADLADLRRRCLVAAHERYNWETEVARLLRLYADLGAARGLPETQPTEGLPAPLDERAAAHPEGSRLAVGTSALTPPADEADAADGADSPDAAEPAGIEGWRR